MIYVGEAGKVGDGVNAYHVYPVRSSLAAPVINEVERRYSDFVWLQTQLHKTCPGCIVPPLPAKVVGLLHSREFLEARRIGLQKFLTNVAAHDVLALADCFVQFLQVSAMELSQCKLRSKSNEPKQALSSWFGKAVQKWSEHDKVQTFAAKAYGKDISKPKSDQDREFDQIAAYVNALEAQAKTLQQKVLAAYRANKASCNAYCEVIEATSAMADLEAPLPEMKAVAFTSFIQILDNRAKHFDSEWDALADGVDDFARWIGSVQAALATREDRRFAYQAQLAAVNKLSATPDSPTQRNSFSSFMSSSPNPAAMVTSLAEAQQAYDEVHNRVMSEVLKFREEKASALKNLYLSFASLQLDNAKEFSDTLQRVLPRMKEASSIAVPKDEIRRATMPSLTMPFGDNNQPKHDEAAPASMEASDKPYVDVSFCPAIQNAGKVYLGQSRMSSASDDDSERSNSSDEGSSDDESSVETSSVDESDQESDEESDDEEESDEDNQVNEAMQEKKKAIREDLASIHKIAAHMDKVYYRLLLRYGNDNKEPPLPLELPKDVLKDEKPEVESPAKPTVEEVKPLTPKKEAPVLKSCQDVGTDSRDLIVEASQRKDAATDAENISTNIVLDPKLMGSIEIKPKSNIVRPGIASECRLKMELASQSMLHLSEYMNPPPVMKLPKRPAPEFAQLPCKYVSKLVSALHTPVVVRTIEDLDSTGDQCENPISLQENDEVKTFNSVEPKSSSSIKQRDASPVAAKHNNLQETLDKMTEKPVEEISGDRNESQKDATSSESKQLSSTAAESKRGEDITPKAPILASIARRVMQTQKTGPSSTNINPASHNDIRHTDELTRTIHQEESLSIPEVGQKLDTDISKSAQEVSTIAPPQNQTKGSSIQTNDPPFQVPNQEPQPGNDSKQTIVADTSTRSEDVKPITSPRRNLGQEEDITLPNEQVADLGLPTIQTKSPLAIEVKSQSPELVPKNTKDSIVAALELEKFVNYKPLKHQPDNMNDEDDMIETNGDESVPIEDESNPFGEEIADEYEAPDNSQQNSSHTPKMSPTQSSPKPVADVQSDQLPKPEISHFGKQEESPHLQPSNFANSTITTHILSEQETPSLVEVLVESTIPQTTSDILQSPKSMDVNFVPSPRTTSRNVSVSEEVLNVENMLPTKANTIEQVMPLLALRDKVPPLYANNDSVQSTTTRPISPNIQGKENTLKQLFNTESSNQLGPDLSNLQQEATLDRKSVAPQVIPADRQVNKAASPSEPSFDFQEFQSPPNKSPQAFKSQDFDLFPMPAISTNYAGGGITKSPLTSPQGLFEKPARNQAIEEEVNAMHYLLFGRAKYS